MDKLVVTLIILEYSVILIYSGVILLQATNTKIQHHVSILLFPRKARQICRSIDTYAYNLSKPITSPLNSQSIDYSLELPQGDNSNEKSLDPGLMNK